MNRNYSKDFELTWRFQSLWIFRSQYVLKLHKQGSYQSWHVRDKNAYYPAE